VGGLWLIGQALVFCFTFYSSYLYSEVNENVPDSKLLLEDTGLIKEPDH